MHHRRMLRLMFVFSIAAGLLLASVGTVSAGNGNTQATYEVTIENLTGGQPLTPPVVTTHKPGLKLFRVGKSATDELAAIARDGNLAPMVDLLSNSNQVNSFLVAGAGPLLPGSSVTVEIEGRPTERISFASMLVCTNDGFTGLDRVKLPISGSLTLYADAYDSGVEMNTELAGDLVPPCLGGGNNNAGIETSDPIMHHPGVQGTGDLTVGAHGWSDPVVKITIERVD